jgi:hypothetical protein
VRPWAGLKRYLESSQNGTFAVHAVREAIYLSPGHGSPEPDTRQSPAAWDGRPGRWNR